MENKQNKKVFCFFKPVDRHRDEVLTLRHAKSLQEAGYRALSRSYEEKDKLKAEGEQQVQEINSLKA